MKNAKNTPKPSESLFGRLGGLVKNYLDTDVERNIVEAILQDHEDLKALLKLLKDGDESLERKQTAFKLFKVLLTSHSVAEEKALYAISTHLQGSELKTAEGIVEHDLCNLLLDRIRKPSAAHRGLHWKAQVQVLAELVEHHIEEEERDLLPQIRRKVSPEALAKASKLFLRLRSGSQRIKSVRNRGALAKRAR